MYTDTLVNVYMTKALTRGDIVALCNAIETTFANVGTSRGGKCTPSMDAKQGIAPTLTLGKNLCVQLLIAGPTASTQWHEAGKLPFDQWSDPAHIDDVVLSVDINISKYKNGRVVVLNHDNACGDINRLRPILKSFGIEWVKETKRRGSNKQAYSRFADKLYYKRLDERTALNNARRDDTSYY